MAGGVQVPGVTPTGGVQVLQAGGVPAPPPVGVPELPGVPVLPMDVIFSPWQDNTNRDTNNTKETTPQWKFDRTLSFGTTYKRGGKTYHWCTGPGHKDIAMWTLHKPNTCGGTSQTGSNTSAKPSKQGNPTIFDAKAMAAALTSQGYTDQEVESKIEAILAVLGS